MKAPTVLRNFQNFRYQCESSVKYWSGSIPSLLAWVLCDLFSFVVGLATASQKVLYFPFCHVAIG